MNLQTIEQRTDDNGSKYYLIWAETSNIKFEKLKRIISNSQYRNRVKLESYFKKPPYNETADISFSVALYDLTLISKTEDYHIIKTRLLLNQLKNAKTEIWI